MIQIKVTKMNCGGCARSVTTAVLGVDPLASVDIDLKQGVVSIVTTAGSPEARFADAIRSTGYGAGPLTLAA
jgi:copper chaperone